MVLAVPLIPTFILIALHQTGWGFAALGVASLAAGWIAYSNAAAGCWKCLAYWALITSIGWGVVALGQWSRSGNWRWLYVGAAVGLILALVVPKKSAASSSEDKTGTARSSLTKRTLAPLAVLGGFILVIALSTHSTNPLSPVESDCTSAPAITGAVGDDNTRIEAVGIFKSGTTESQAESYESSFASMNSGCFSLAEITTTTSGLKVMSVRELPSVIRYTQPHVLKSLISSGLFSSVTK
jgi:hypothetical protein